MDDIAEIHNPDDAAGCGLEAMLCCPICADVFRLPSQAAEGDGVTHAPVRLTPCCDQTVCWGCLCKNAELNANRCPLCNKGALRTLLRQLGAPGEIARRIDEPLQRLLRVWWAPELRHSSREAALSSLRTLDALPAPVLCASRAGSLAAPGELRAEYETLQMEQRKQDVQGEVAALRAMEAHVQGSARVAVQFRLRALQATLDGQPPPEPNCEEQRALLECQPQRSPPSEPRGKIARATSLTLDSMFRRLQQQHACVDLTAADATARAAHCISPQLSPPISKSQITPKEVIVLVTSAHELLIRARDQLRSTDGDALAALETACDATSACLRAVQPSLRVSPASAETAASPSVRSVNSPPLTTDAASPSSLQRRSSGSEPAPGRKRARVHVVELE